MVNRIDSLAAQCQPGRTLPRAFFSDEEVYQADLNTIWRRGWLFAGHSCEIPKPGDYFTLNLDTDSVLVVRGENGEAHALHNLCRHRGSLICDDSCGHVRHLACPYHRWTYALDGTLLHAPGMQEDLPKSELGLRHVALREFEGLIYISLADEPPDFEAAREVLGNVARPQGFTRAKVAKAVDYLVKA